MKFIVVSSFNYKTKYLKGGAIGFSQAEFPPAC